MTVDPPNRPDRHLEELGIYTLAGQPASSRDLIGEVQQAEQLGLGSTRRCVAAVKTAAERAGRAPDTVQVWSCLATVGDHLHPDLRLMKTVGRLATYLQGYGDLLVRTNGWNPDVLERFRADATVSGFLGGIDSTATTAQLEHIATLLPDEWLAASARGTPEQCAAAVRGQLDLGCDGVIMHGATPDELEPVIAAYRADHPPTA